jgi:type IV pilus assembly protein PilB
MQSPSRRLGEFLVDRKVLSRDTLEVMLDREAKEGTPLPRLLAADGLVSEKDLMAAVAHQVGMPFVDLDETSIDPSVDRLIPAELARASTAVAIEEGVAKKKAA